MTAHPKQIALRKVFKGTPYNVQFLQTFILQTVLHLTKSSSFKVAEAAKQALLIFKKALTDSKELKKLVSSTIVASQNTFDIAKNPLDGKSIPRIQESAIFKHNDSVSVSEVDFISYSQIDYQ